MKISRDTMSEIELELCRARDLLEVLGDRVMEADDTDTPALTLLSAIDDRLRAVEAHLGLNSMPLRLFEIRKAGEPAPA